VKRLLLFIIVIPLVVVILAAVLVPMLVDKQKILQLAQDTLKEQTGATLDVRGDVSFSVFPTIAVTLADTAVTLPEETEPTATAENLAIGVQLIPLFSRRVEIGGILIDGFHARLKPAAAGADMPDTATLSKEQQKALEEAQKEALAEQAQVLAAPLALSIDELTVTDSSVEMLAAEGDPTRVEIERIYITDVNTAGRPLNMTAKLAMVGSDGESALALDTNGQLIVDADARTVDLSELSVTVSGAGDDDLDLNLNGAADLAQLSADLQLTFETGESRGEGSVSYSAMGRPEIVAELRMNLLNEALLALAGPDAAAAQEEADDSDAEATGDEPLPLETIRALSTKFDLTVDKAIYEGYQVDNLKLKGRAMDGVAQIGSMTGDLFGGKLNLRATFNAKEDVAKLNTKGSIEGVDIAALLKAAEVESNMVGTATMDWQFNSRGTTSNELVNNLSGPANLNTDGVVLQDVGIEKMLCEAVAMVNQETLTTELPETSTLDDLSARVVMRNGNAVLSPLSVDARAVGLRGEGRLGLLSQDFQATFAAKITPELAELDPACRVNERYSSIEWPVSCQGNVGTDPAEWCGVDTQKIIEELAKNEAKRKIEKEAGRLLDKLFKD